MDLVFVVLTLLFFALSWLLLVLCERLMVGNPPSTSHGS